MAGLLDFPGAVWIGRRFIALSSFADSVARPRSRARSFSACCGGLAHAGHQRGVAGACVRCLVHVVGNPAAFERRGLYLLASATVLAHRDARVARLVSANSLWTDSFQVRQPPQLRCGHLSAFASMPGDGICSKELLHAL